MVALLRGHQLERGMLDAAAVHDLRALLELLAAGAVEALVVRHEQVVGAPLLDALEQRHHSADVARLGRTDAIVIAAEQPPPARAVGSRGWIVLPSFGKRLRWCT